MESVVDATRAELAGFPRELAESAIAAGALAMARELDSTRNSATSKAMCFGRLQEAMRELRELVPDEEASDVVSDIEAQRAKRLARLPRTAN